MKASQLTPRSYWAIGKAFHDAGLPNGVLNVLSCPPSRAAEIVNTIIEHPAVRKIDFTGSAATGRKVARTCGQNLKPCLMELGGKNSAIILEDADLELATQACLASSFINVCATTLNEDTILITIGWTNLHGDRPYHSSEQCRTKVPRNRKRQHG
jgi:acyl-CoA reductase-like NAD-dependent aldehyde dehydrogenase